MLNLPDYTLVNHIVLQEDLVEGESITEYEILVDFLAGDTPVQVMVVNSVGHKRII